MDPRSLAVCAPLDVAVSNNQIFSTPLYTEATD